MLQVRILIRIQWKKVMDPNTYRRAKNQRIRILIPYVYCAIVEPFFRNLVSKSLFRVLNLEKRRFKDGEAVFPFAKLGISVAKFTLDFLYHFEKANHPISYKISHIHPFCGHSRFSDWCCNCLFIKLDISVANFMLFGLYNHNRMFSFYLTKEKKYPLSTFFTFERRRIRFKFTLKYFYFSKGISKHHPSIPHFIFPIFIYIFSLK